MMSHFEVKQQAELKLEHSDKEIVVLSALSNDLGQGIFSHLFDRILIPRLAPSLKWDYKDASVMMFKDLIDKNHIDIDPIKSKVVDLIKGEFNPDSAIGQDKAWLFDIVSNKRNAIDADKFDYIQRDTFNIYQHKKTVDPSRLIHSCKVIDNQVCYHIKNNEYLKFLFQERYDLFKQVYNHRVCWAINFMVVDALMEVNPVYKFVENLNNPSKFYFFTDSLVKFISTNKKPEFKSARDILKKIETR